MKQLLVIGIFILIVSTERSYAHKEHIHQYICREAYELIVLQTGIEFSPMRSHLGNTETGDGAFNPGGKIVIGAFREDRDDVVWGYGSSWGPLQETAAVTHFWDPDQGDGSQFCTSYCVLPGATYCYPNAYHKVMKYVYGGWDIQVYYAGVGITEVYQAPSFLPQYYKDHQIYYKGYYAINGEFVTRGYWTTSSQGFVDRIVWEILGRMAHLLQDISVPAHAHNDQHDPFCGGTDFFENAMDNNNSYTFITRQTALNAGGIINVNNHSNPLKYLFYTTSQIANHFPSNDVQGNNLAGLNEPFSNYPPLESIINSLGPPPTTVNPGQIGTTTLTYSIRATAGLFYWFAKNAGLFPPSVSISGPSFATCATATWTSSVTNGLPPFTYKWYHQWDCDGGGGGGGEMMALSDPTPNAECNPVWNELASTSPSLQYYLCCGNAILRVDVTDALGRVASAQHYVVGNCGGGGPVEAGKTDGVSVADELLVPTDFHAFQNFPNPFNPETEIRFALPEPSSVRVTVSDALGREIMTIVDREYPPGHQRVSWKGTDEHGNKVGSGVYFYRIVAIGQSGRQFTKVLKMALTK